MLLVHVSSALCLSHHAALSTLDLRDVVLLLQQYTDVEQIARNLCIQYTGCRAAVTRISSPLFIFCTVTASLVFGEMVEGNVQYNRLTRSGHYRRRFSWKCFPTSS